MTSRNKMLIISMLLIAVLFIMPVQKVLGASMLDPTRDASLTMTLKAADPYNKVAAGAEVTIYLVAEGNYSMQGISFDLTSDYLASGIDLENKITQSMIDDLVQYTEDNSITGQSKKADANGLVSFTGLASGVYLVAATDLPDGFTSFVPFLYFLPYYSADQGGWIYDGVAEPKMNYLPPADISVRKVWNDDGKNRPASVSVRLENEDGIYDTVVLNDSNSWQYTWTGLDASKNWNVTEINVPAEYKVTYSSSGFDFTVTNTKKLIQTGQTNWPVPVMIFAGSFLVCAGIIVKVTGRKKNEG